MFICAVFIQFLEILDLWSIQGSLNRDLDLISSQKLPKISKNFRAGLGSLSSHYLPFIREGRKDVTTFIHFFKGVVGFTGANPSYLSGQRHYTPWTSSQPLLMAEAAMQGANCTSEAILGFSILLKDTLTCSPVPPQGSGDSITRRTALPTELQPIYWKRIDALNSKIQNTFLPKEIFCLNIFYFHICWHLVFQK